MPKLDGISATSIIRKFDHLTPIISMTGNSKPNEIMTYFSSGGFTQCYLVVVGADDCGFDRRYERYTGQTIH